MAGLSKWLRTHTYEAHLIVFALQIIPPVLLYLAAQGGGAGWIWTLLSLVVLGNILVLFAR